MPLLPEKKTGESNALRFACPFFSINCDDTTTGSVSSCVQLCPAGRDSAAAVAAGASAVSAADAAVVVAPPVADVAGVPPDVAPVQQPAVVPVVGAVLAS